MSVNIHIFFMKTFIKLFTDIAFIQNKCDFFNNRVKSGL